MTKHNKQIVKLLENELKLVNDLANSDLTEYKKVKSKIAKAKTVQNLKIALNAMLKAIYSFRRTYLLEKKNKIERDIGLEKKSVITYTGADRLQDIENKLDMLFEMIREK